MKCLKRRKIGRLYVNSERASKERRNKETKRNDKVPTQGVSLSSFEDVLDSIIRKFSPSQQTSYLYWANVPDKIKETRASYKEARGKLNKWNNIDQIFIIFAVIVPIITTGLTSTLNLTIWVNLLSAVFPVLVGLVRGNTKVWGQKRDGYNNLIFQYEKLLCDVVGDISSNRYTQEVEDKYKKDLDDLETEHRRIDSLDKGQ
jgi:hypothetical protein